MTFQDFKSKYQKAPVEEYPNSVADSPVVSVCVMTYQHKDYIRECLDGILMQKIDFPFEILLGEDASTDGTREICIEYAERYPDIIRLFLHDRANNIAIGGHPTGRFNFLYNLFSARGKYISLCEGDDYWTDPQKLQKQIDILENHLYLHIVYHRVKTIGSRARQLSQHSNKQGYFDFIDSIQIKQGSTLSMVFRKANILDVDIGSYLMDLHIADWPLECLCMLNGRGFYIDEEMGCYRMEGTGLSANLNRATYLITREKICDRLLQMDTTRENKDIIQRFLNRILLLRLYYNFVNGNWDMFSKDISDLIKKYSIKMIPNKNIKWNKHYQITRILLKFPLGILLGIKNKVHTTRQKVK